MKRTAIRLCALVFVAFASCGGGSSDQKSDPIAGTCDSGKLPGLWTSSKYSIRIGKDLSFVAAGAPNVQTIHVQGTVEVDGCTIRFKDTSGVYACPAEQVGTYTFSVTDSALHLTVSSDACDGRRIPVDGATLSRG